MHRSETNALPFSVRFEKHLQVAIRPGPECPFVAQPSARHRAATPGNGLVVAAPVDRASAPPRRRPPGTTLLPVRLPAIRTTCAPRRSEVAADPRVRLHWLARRSRRLRRRYSGVPSCLKAAERNGGGQFVTTVTTRHPLGIRPIRSCARTGSDSPMSCRAASTWPHTFQSSTPRTFRSDT